MKSKIFINWNFSTYSMDTEYGVITYLDWCKREIKRIGKHLYLVERGKKCCVKKDAE